MALSSVGGQAGLTRAGWGGVTLLLLVALSIQGMSATSARGAQDNTSHSRTGTVHCDAVQVAARMMKVRREGRSQAVRPACWITPRVARVGVLDQPSSAGALLAPVPMLRHSLLALPPPLR